MLVSHFHLMFIFLLLVPFDSSSRAYSSIRGSIHFGDSKRDSLASVRSDASSVSNTSSVSAGTLTGAAVDHGSTNRFSRFSTAVLARTSALDRGGHESAEAPDGNLSAAEEVATALFSQPPLSLVDPYRAFVHNLYIYPKNLNLSVKHTFGRVSH